MSKKLSKKQLKQVKYIARTAVELFGPDIAHTEIKAECPYIARREAVKVVAEFEATSAVPES